MDHTLRSLQDALKRGDVQDATRLTQVAMQQWREHARKLRSLEMITASEKRELYEDPLKIHEMHFQS